MRKMILLMLLILFLVGNVSGNIIWDGGTHYRTNADTFIGEVELINGGEAYISGGEIHRLETYDICKAEISGGEMYALWTDGLSEVTISSGDVGRILARSNSQVTISGGSVDYLVVEDSAGIIVVGDIPSFVYTTTGGEWGYGGLTGVLSDQSVFDIDFSSTDTFSHIQIVPEPTTLALFIFGTVAIALKKKKH